ncbi:MAG: hypothetical protein Q8M88_01110, partial [Phenylobacterium sp.]
MTQTLSGFLLKISRDQCHCSVRTKGSMRSSHTGMRMPKAASIFWLQVTVYSGRGAGWGYCAVVVGRSVAQPFSAPDSCDARGQKLNPWAVSWDWTSSDTLVAYVTSFTTKGKNPYCTSWCVRKGSDIPTSSAANLPVCGNAVVEAGEDCDPPGAAAGCNLDCRRPGNNNATTTMTVPADEGLCGDGVVQTTLGEICDPAAADPLIKLGCGANCLRAGSSQTTKAVDINTSICGNGFIGAGEDCDFGISGIANDPQSAMGCSGKCLHLGTRLSTFWCFQNKTEGQHAGFTTSSYLNACAGAYSQCGDKVENPDEDPGCDNSATGWNE